MSDERAQLNLRPGGDFADAFRVWCRRTGRNQAAVLRGAFFLFARLPAVERERIFEELMIWERLGCPPEVLDDPRWAVSIDKSEELTEENLKKKLDSRPTIG